MDGVKLWDDRLEVGIDSLDREHRFIIERIEDFVRAVRNKVVAPSIPLTLTAFNGYFTDHFADEERYMRFYGDPHLDEHIQAHNELLTGFIRVVHDYEVEGASRRVINQLLGFTINDLTNMITTHDRRMADYLRRAGAVELPLESGLAAEAEKALAGAETEPLAKT